MIVDRRDQVGAMTLARAAQDRARPDPILARSRSSTLGRLGLAAKA